MKRIIKPLALLLAVAVLCLSLAACGKSKGATGAELMQGIFDKLTANAEYNEWKASFNATTIEEKLDGTTITVSAAGEEGLNGDYAFTLEGDYIVATGAEGDYSIYALLTNMMAAVADYYGMNRTLMNGYLAGLGNFDKENTFLVTETADGRTTYQLYAADAWKMDGLDEMYINEKALAYIDPLTENDVNSVINSGKVSAITYGNKTALTLIVGEYGENTALTLKSVQSMVAKLQPDGYEAFASEYTELKETAGSGYTVSFGIPADVAQQHAYTEAAGYSYVTVVFAGDAAVSAS